MYFFCILIYKWIAGRFQDRKSRALLKWMAQKNVQTRAAGIIDSLDDPEKLLANQSNPGHIANRAVVAANVIKTLQQKAAQLNIV